MNDDIVDDLRRNFPKKLGNGKFEIVQVNEVPRAGEFGEWLGFWKGFAVWLKRTLVGEKVGLVVYLLMGLGLYNDREVIAKSVTHVEEGVWAQFCSGGPAPACLDMWHSLSPQPVSAFPDPRVAVTNGCAVYFANSNSNAVIFSAGTSSFIVGGPDDLS